MDVHKKVISVAVLSSALVFDLEICRRRQKCTALKNLVVALYADGVQRTLSVI